MSGMVGATSAGKTQTEHPVELRELDGAMTGADFIAILQQLSFGGHPTTTIKIDADARDFLVASIATRCGKA